MFIEKNDKDVHCGRFWWIENNREHSGDAFFHPPTNARPYEGRLANVDRYLPTNNLPAEAEGTAILLLVQDDDGKVWPHFTTDHSLESEDWHTKVKEAVLNCLHAKRRSGVSMVGFVDFVNKEFFCNGK